MGAVNKVLAQDAPGPALTDLYEAPKSTLASASLVVCNQGVFSETFRVAIALKGESNQAKQYLVFDKVIAANSTEVVGSIYLQPTDVVRVWASVSDVSFNLVGTETK